MPPSTCGASCCQTLMRATEKDARESIHDVPTAALRISRLLRYWARHLTGFCSDLAVASGMGSLSCTENVILRFRFPLPAARAPTRTRFAAI